MTDPDLAMMKQPVMYPKRVADLESRLGAPLRWESWVEVLRHHAAAHPQREALAFLPRLEAITRRVSWGELERGARAIGAALQALGAEGERALLLVDNSPGYLQAFFGCLHARCVGVTLHPPASKKHVERLAHVARDAGARLVLTTRAFAERFRERVAVVPGLSSLEWLIIDEVDDAMADEWRETRPGGGEIAYLQYTSGSTGQPSGVVVTHLDLVLQAEMIGREFNFTSGDRVLSWMPLFHDMGLILGALQPLYEGVPLYLSTPMAFIKHPGRWLRSIGEHAITFSGGPDFCYELCAEAIDPGELEGVDLSRWEMALTAAEPVRASTVRRFVEAFGRFGFDADRFHPGYGLAEATLGVSVKARHAPLVMRQVALAPLSAGRVVAPQGGEQEQRTLIASGQVFSTIDVRIVDPQRAQELGPLRIGEVWVDSPGVASGYWRQPGKTQEVFGATLAGDDGRRFLRTGDLGFVDEQGLIYITGRLKDVIIVRGKNHFPSDIEQTIEGASGVIRSHFSAVFSVETGERERVVAVAEVRRDRVEGLDVERLGHELRQHVAATHEIVLDEVVFVRQGQLPKTTSGKIQRARARVIWQADGFEVHGRSRRM